jgi:moderate conductance mechanosensitive channel
MIDTTTLTTDSTTLLTTLSEIDATSVNDFWHNLLSWFLTSGIRIVLIIAIAWFLKMLSKRIVNRLTHAASKSSRISLNEGEAKRMGTIARLFNWTFSTVIVLIATMMVLIEFKINITPILTGAGIMGVAIGFGGQYLVRDIITGFFIIFENQYRIGDVVNIGGLSGSVEDITLRVTTLRDMNGTVHHIPHGEIKTVSNSSKEYSKINLNIGVSYAADLNQVKEVINKVGATLAAEKYWKDLITEAPAFLRVDSLDDSSIALKVVGVTKPSKQWEVTGELRKRLKEAFDANGIEIPFPQHVVYSAPTK